MILKQIMYQWINYVAGKINKTFFFKVRTVQLCINNNISNDGCKMSNYITQYENNVCMYTRNGTISNTVNWIMYKHVVLFVNSRLFILNTSLTIMLRGMEQKINK